MFEGLFNLQLRSSWPMRAAAAASLRALRQDLRRSERISRLLFFCRGAWGGEAVNHFVETDSLPAFDSEDPQAELVKGVCVFAVSLTGQFAEQLIRLLHQREPRGDLGEIWRLRSVVQPSSSSLASQDCEPLRCDSELLAQYRSPVLGCPRLSWATGRVCLVKARPLPERQQTSKSPSDTLFAWQPLFPAGDVRTWHNAHQIHRRHRRPSRRRE